MRRLTLLGLTLALAMPLLLGSGCQTVQATGRRELLFLSWEDEISLGQEAAPELEEEYGGPLEDPVVQGYVSEVGRRVAASSTHPELPYKFTVLDSDVLNAFALPGGPVYITRALLKEMETEAQLAAVLGHEAAHVNARHAATQISRQMGLSVLIAAAGAATGAEGAGDLARVVGALVGLKYSRDMESEADWLGLDYIVAAGYDPQGMVQLLRVFVEMEGGRPPELLSTHPNPDNRVGAIQERIDERNYRGRGGRVGADDFRRRVLDRL